MRKTAFVLGASGQVGQAVIGSLLSDGWTVRAGSRSEHEWPESVEGVVVDRDDDDSFHAAIGGGVDVLVDCVAYTSAHARQIASAADRIGSAIVLSSMSVYTDAEGRTLDEATDVDSFPSFPVPILEEHMRTPPGVENYSTRKVAMEDVLLDASTTLPVTVLRPGAIYGPGSSHPRELWFVKRALDRRPVQLLNWSGESRFHMSNSRNIAEVVRLAAHTPGRRVLHAVDEKVLTTAEIAEAVNVSLDHRPAEFLLAGHSRLGRTPWSVPGPKPMIVSMSAAELELGYRPVASFVDSVQEIVGRITRAISGKDWTDVYPVFLRANGREAFDYDAEDAWVRGH